MDTDFYLPYLLGEGEKMFIQDTEQTKYPVISDDLINALETDFPNKLPQNYVDEFELGKLLGQQEVINKLKAEKEFIEKESEEG